MPEINELEEFFQSIAKHEWFVIMYALGENNKWKDAHILWYDYLPTSFDVANDIWSYVENHNLPYDIKEYKVHRALNREDVLELTQYMDTLQ